MNLKTSYKYLGLAVMFMASAACSSDDNNVVPEEPITSGEADFSTYVALGNSLTAGITDSALFIEGQKNSMPFILSQQFALAGGGDFSQPMMSDNLGGLLLLGTQITQNRFFFDGSGPAVLPGTPTTEVSNILSGPFNNMGVPGAKSFHLVAPGYGNIAGVATGAANPYFVRMASSPTTTVLADAVAQSPTFFTLWIGNNDVLSYALSGGAGTNQIGNLDPTTYGPNDITDPNVFASVFNTLVSTLTAGGADGVVANIFDVISIPNFTTVPHDPVPLDEATANSLNAQLFGPLIQILTALGEPDRFMTVSSEEENPVLIVDETLTNYSAQIAGALQGSGISADQAMLMGDLYGQARHATSDDLVLLVSSSLIGEEQAGIPAPFNTIAVTYPFQDQYVLIPSEIMQIRTATAAYNATIASVAETHGLALVDTNALIDELASVGADFDEFTLKDDFIFGGAFSLDGVHPGARGYAFLANTFIEEINEKYGSNLPPVAAADYVTLFSANLP